MKDHIQSLLLEAVRPLAEQYGISPKVTANIRVDRTKDREHGDFATNIAMMVAKQMQLKPLEAAQKIISSLPSSPRIAKIEAAPPGFINFYISRDYLSSALGKMEQDSRLGVPKCDKPQTVVVDYSSPNVAKEMAVHHIRSTVIGDSVVRVLEFLGHKVIRANHIGDWGTQFGMLIAYLERQQQERGSDLGLTDFEAFYREAKELYDGDEEFARTARSYVVKLQGKDPRCLEMWKRLVSMTMEQNQAIYEELDVTLTGRDIMGESLYNDMLGQIAEDLEKKGLAVTDNGALVVYLDEYKNKEGKPLGVIIRKQDGGFLYTTTDLACIKYRVDKLHADRIMYFVDSRQQQHLECAWAIARKAGYLPEGVRVEHDAFGMMLGKDGKPFKTRSGGTVKLRDLIEEAYERVGKLLKELGTEMGGQDEKTVIHNVAIGAIKYADLSKNRLTDYVFDWDLMLSLDGNTAPYLQYAYSRIASIFRKADVQPGEIIIAHELEDELAGKLTAFPDAVAGVGQKAMPHLLCTYLYELSGSFMRFYEACPVLKGDVEDKIKRSRLALCSLTMKVLRQGLDLLGIKVMEQM